MIPASFVVFFIVLCAVLGILDIMLIVFALSIVGGVIYGIVKAIYDKKQTQNQSINYKSSNTISFNSKSKTKKQPPKKDYTEYWETHCESCGELLEDCECEWKHYSKEDISLDNMDDLEFDEMNDIWDELDEEDKDF